MTITPTKSDIGALVVLLGKGEFDDMPGTLKRSDGESASIVLFGNMHETEWPLDRLEWGERNELGNVVVSREDRK